MDASAKSVIGHPTDEGCDGELNRPGGAIDACYTPALTAKTGKSNDGTAPERARDGASRAGTTT